MNNDGLITPLSTDYIDESSSDALFSIRSDESLIDGVVVKEGRIYLGNSERLIFKFRSA